MLLAQKQIHRLTEYKRKCRNKPTQTYDQLNYNKGGKNRQWRKESLLNKWCQENWIATHKRIKLENYLILHTKINSKWVKDLNLQLDTTELLEENIED